MLAFKILENCSPGGVLASLGRYGEDPRGSVDLPERSGKVAGGFGGILVRF